MPSLLVGPSDGRMAVGRTSRPTSESTRARWAAQKLVKTPPCWAPLPGDSVRRTRARLGATLLSRLVARGGFLGFRVGPHDSAGYEPHDLGRVLAHDLGRVLAEWRPTSTAMPRSSQSNSEGAGATVEELRSRVFATNPCNAKRFISHAEGEQLQEGALAGLQAGGRRGHGPLGVLPKCFDDRADERGGDGRAGPHGRRPGALPPFPFSASWQGRCCEGAAVKALLCRRFLAGLPGVPPEQCHRLHLREPRVPRTPCGAPITTPRGRSFPHSRIGLLADFMLVQALLLPANLEQGHYCMPTSGPRRHVGQG